MRYPLAIWRPGPQSKQGYPGHAVNDGRGVVCHSMVGYLAGAMARLDSDDRASWHFSVLQDGHVYQHYDTAAVTWHCGSPTFNGRLIGIEHEGGYDPVDEALTQKQRESSVALVRWLSGIFGFPLERKVSLWEHNEVAPPTGATSCPSNRIPWDQYTEDAMTKEEKQQLDDTTRALVDVRTQLNELAAAVDVLPGVKGQLRYLWALSGKKWPF